MHANGIGESLTEKVSAHHQLFFWSVALGSTVSHTLQAQDQAAGKMLCPGSKLGHKHFLYQLKGFRLTNCLSVELSSLAIFVF